MSQIQIRVCCLALIVMMLWLGGFGCATCCAMEQTMARGELAQSPAVESSQPVESSATDFIQEPDCCKQKIATKSQAIAKQTTDAAKSEATTLEISALSSVAACSLLPKHAAGFVTTKSSPDNLDVQIAEGALSFVPSDESKRQPSFPVPLLHNRSGTYLRCCIFL